MSLKSDFLSIFPTALDDMNLNALSMTFKGQEEHQYWQARLDKELSQKRIGIIIGVVLFLILGLADWLLMPEIKQIAWFFRFAVYMPLALIAFITSYLSFAKRLLQPIASGVLFATGFIQILVLLKAPISAVQAYQSVMALMAIYGFTILRTNFLYTLASLSAVYLCYFSYIFTLSPLPVNERWSTVVLTLLALVITAFGGYMLEYAQRRNYYLSLGRGSKVVPTTKGSKSDKSGKAHAGSPSQAQAQAPQTVVKTVESPVNKLFENLADMIWFVSLDGYIKYISPSVKEFLGYEAEDLVGKRAVSIMTSESYASFDEMAARLYRDKNRIQAQFEYKTRAGLIKQGDVVMKRFQDKRYGEGYIGTTRPAQDITLVVDQAQEPVLSKEPSDQYLQDTAALNALRADLEDQKHLFRQVAAERDDLMSKLSRANDDIENRSEISHSALAELLERMAAHYAQQTQSQLNEHLKEIEIVNDKFTHQSMSKYDLENYLKAGKDKIIQTSNSLEVLKDRVTLFKSYLKPSEHLNAQTYQLRALLEESVLKLKQFFKGTKHIIEINCPRGVEIETDKLLFEQVVNNMIMHSLQFSFAHIRNGKIQLDVEVVEGQIFLVYKDNGDKLHADVIDEMFARMIHPELEALEGLELHLVRQIVEKHLRGSIGCEYNASENTFRLILPARW